MWKTLLVWEVVVASAHAHSPCRLLHEVITDFRLDDVRSEPRDRIGLRFSNKHNLNILPEYMFTYRNTSLTLKKNVLHF